MSDATIDFLELQRLLTENAHMADKIHRLESAIYQATPQRAYRTPHIAVHTDPESRCQAIRQAFEDTDRERETLLLAFRTLTPLLGVFFLTLHKPDSIGMREPDPNEINLAELPVVAQRLVGEGLKLNHEFSRVCIELGQTKAALAEALKPAPADLSKPTPKKRRRRR